MGATTRRGVECTADAVTEARRLTSTVRLSRGEDSMVRPRGIASQIVLGRVLMAVAMVIAGARAADAQQAGPPVPTVVTAGEAVLKRAPDRAWVLVATDAHAPKPADARRLGAQAMTDVQAALRATGLAAEAIRTVAYSLEPETAWNNGRATITGYVAHNQIEVRVDDLDKLPDVLDAANTPKNVSLTIDGPRFDLKDRETVERAVLSSAVENAMARARAMADGAKVTLGAILSIQNQTPPSEPVRMPMTRVLAVAGGADNTPATPVTPGEIAIQARVTVSIAIR
jgi:uncharacterized protein YggE